MWLLQQLWKRDISCQYLSLTTLNYVWGAFLFSWCNSVAICRQPKQVWPFHLQPLIWRYFQSSSHSSFFKKKKILLNLLWDSAPPDKAYQFPHGRALGSFSPLPNVSVRWKHTAVKWDERSWSDCSWLKPIIIPPNPASFTLALQVHRRIATASGSGFTKNLSVTGQVH